MPQASITLDRLQQTWQREWIEVNGEYSRNKTVLWAQCGALFVDIRIPYQRPDTAGRSSLSELSAAELAELRGAEGFAGHVELSESVCTWHREINWHGVSLETDAGRLGFTNDGGLIETGVHASYAELWRPTDYAAVDAYRVQAGALQGIIMTSDSHFMLGIGFPVENIHTSEDAAHHFLSEYLFGTWQGASGIAGLSTNPFSEQQCVLTRERDAFIWHRQNFQGDVSNVPLQH